MSYICGSVFTTTKIQGWVESGGILALNIMKMPNTKQVVQTQKNISPAKCCRNVDLEYLVTQSLYLSLKRCDKNIHGLFCFEINLTDIIFNHLPCFYKLKKLIDVLSSRQPVRK